MSEKVPVPESSLNLLANSFLVLETKEDAIAYLTDLLTIKELQDIAQRLEVASLLEGRSSYLEIAKMTGASTATISRVNRSLIYGNEGYHTVLERMGIKTYPRPKD